MRRPARAARVVAVVGSVFIVLMLIVVATFTETRWGHERVRATVLGFLRGHTHGIVRMGSISGDLLRGVTLRNLSITDSSGAPFIAADEATTRYDLGQLLRKRIVLRGLRLVRPVVVLDRPPGGRWNYERIFPRDTTPGDTTPGWGAWIRLEDATIDRGRILVRTPWSPDTALSPPTRDSVVAAALGGATRIAVVRAGNGFQKVSDFRDVTGRLPLVILAEHGTDVRRIEIASMRLEALAFRPPAADVSDLQATFRFTGDSLWWSDARVRMPNSRVVGSGRYDFASGGLVLAAHGAPAALADFRWVYPRLPAIGGGTLDYAMRTNEGGSDLYVVRNADIRIADTRVAGRFGITLGDTLTIQDTDLRFENVGTKLVEQLVPNVKAPRRGSLTGRAALAGGVHAMRIDGDVSFDDAASGRSRVVAVGEVGRGTGGGFHARALRLTLAPFRVELAKAAAPSLAVGGAITGRATIDGSTRARLAVSGDLRHNDAGNVSHVVGRGAIGFAGARSATLDLLASPVSLTEVGRFFPAIGLHGAVSGPVTIAGPLAALRVDGALHIEGGGSLRATGTLDLASRVKGYDAILGLEVFNLRNILEHGPETALTLRSHVVGQGADPETMRASLAADVKASALDSVSVDSGTVRITIADGVVHADRVEMRGPYLFADATGTFGLGPGRSGTLRYQVRLDSLSRLARWLPPGDTGVVTPRPSRIRDAVARARADSARFARATEVERAATGGTGPKLVVDTPSVVRRDSLGGSLYSAGWVRGTVSRFDMRGRLFANNVVWNGHTVRRGRAEYAWTGARTPVASLAVGVQLDSATTAGFAFDSVDARLAYANQQGRVEVLVRQGKERDYTAKGDFVLHSDHKELHLANVALRFDTTVWRTTHPSAIRWGPLGVEVVNVELRSGLAGRIYANGLLPTHGVANLTLAIDNFEAGHVLDFAQSDLDAHGLVSVHANVAGTTADPRVRGAFGVVNGSWRKTRLPDLRGTLGYAQALLTAHADASRARGAPLAAVDARVPINLALAGVNGSRIDDRPLHVDFRADSLPLEVIPQLTDAVDELTGEAIGAVAVRGTLRHPEMAGALALSGGTVRLVPTGVVVRNLVAAVHMGRDTLVIDSLVGTSGGPVRLAGGVGFRAGFAQPTFALNLAARNAVVLNNERGRLHADADLRMTGPFASTLINGVVTVRNGVIYLPEPSDRRVIGAGDPALFAVADTALLTQRGLAAEQSPLLANLRMDVDVHVNRNTWVRSREANIELYGDVNLDVDRRRQAIIADGFLTTDRGEYTFLTKRFQIKRGSATFVGGPASNPTLQVTGEYEVQQATREALNIRVVIGGTADAPRLSLESDAQPPLSQSDLLSMLAFGRQSSSLLSFASSSNLGGTSATGSAAGATAQFAGKQLAGVALGVAVGQLEGEASRSLGADEFNITPADIPTEASAGTITNFIQGTQFEAGKYTDQQTFVALQAGPFAGPAARTLGLRAQRRTGKGFTLEASLQPRFLLRRPTLLDPDASQIQSRTVYGLFLVRDWRF